MVNFQVAIDGPAGSGKSSISKLVASNLGFIHIDTGAMYRALTLEALNRGIDLENENEYGFINEVSVVYINNKILLNGKDVSDEIRSNIVTNNVSTVSKFLCVREKMVDFQRKSASHGMVLMDGRDIGSVVLPKADVKIFLTATPEERARRRQNELLDKGEQAEFDNVLKEIIERDYKDSNRKISPLVMAEDAILLDTTNLSIEQVLEKITSVVCERMKEKMSNEINEMKDVVLPKRLRVKDIVTGTVAYVKKEYISVDLNNFTEGTMYLDHYTLDKKIDSFIGLVNVGDQIVCEVSKVDEYNSVILLSRLNILKKESFGKIVEAYENKEPITVKVTRKVNKGYIVTCNGFDFFLADSQAPEGDQVGNTLVVRILEVDSHKKTGVVSRRIIEREEYYDAKTKELDSLNVGDVVVGEVSSIENYGVFVKFKYNQGLIRLNQIDHIFVANPNDLLKVSDKVEVKIISKDNGRLALSRKALLKTPYEKYEMAHQVGEQIKAKVAQKLPFGIIMNLADNVTGLLHQSEFSWNPNDNLLNNVRIGDELELAILSIDAKKEKISLSRKALIDNPWSRVKCNPGDEVKATVTGINPKGLVVSCLGVDATVDIRDIVLEGNSSKLEDYYSVGDEITGIVADVNTRNWILRISLKEYQQIQERLQYEKFMGSETEDESNTTLGELFKDVLK